MRVFTFLLFFVVQSGWATQCDRNVGPSGPNQCVPLRQYYNKYQWATCLTNTYIQQQSGHKHICVDRSATYCWYQCMIEVHNKGYGSVSDDCSCDPNAVLPTLALPTECYSPAGDSCDWYRNCLEKKYSCQATSNAYAIKYAEKFCKLYDERYSLFNEDGKKWVDGVRKCLQVALAPLLRGWENPSCETLREKAFDSHKRCYLEPDKGVPSICDLDYLQFLKIFWTIKGSFGKLDTAGKSLEGMFVVGSNCTVRYVSDVAKFLKLKIQHFFQRNRRSTDSLPEADVQSRFTDSVGSAIASALKWNTDVMDWFAYPGHLEDIDYLDIFMVLADKEALGIVTTSVPSVNLNQNIQELASAVEDGTLPLQVDGYNVWVKSLASCSDKSCDNTQTLAVSEKPPNWPRGDAARISHGGVGLCGIVVVIALLMDRLLF